MVAATFYDNIFTSNPKKWSKGGRDELAYRVLKEIVEPKSVLDFGCGNGHTLAYFKKMWPNAKYAGIDISEVALKLAQEKVPGGEFYTDFVGNRQWDLITLMGVAEHFENPTWTLHEIAKHLIPGGRMYLEVPNNLSYTQDKNEGWRADYGSKQWEWHWKRTTWENTIQEAELKIVKSVRGPSPMWEFIWVLE